MRRTLYLLAAAVACVLAGGWLLSATWHIGFGHGLYCAAGLGLTDGCDVLPRGGAEQAVAVAVMLTAIPLLAAAFARLAGAHAGTRMHERLAAAEKRIAAEADQRHVIMQRHVEGLLRGHCADVKDHVSAIVPDDSAVHEKLDALSATLSRLEKAQTASPAPAAPAASSSQQGTGKTSRTGKRV